MAANKKLTRIIKGRTVKSVSQQDGVLYITFDDGSTMRVKLGGAVTADSFPGHTIKGVRQQSTSMNLDFDDGSTADISTAEETSSVMLRDGKGTLEYAD